MFSLAFIRDNFTFILSALPVTLTITLLSLLFSTLLGAALAWTIIRRYPAFNGWRRFSSPLAVRSRSW